MLLKLFLIYAACAGLYALWYHWQFLYGRPKDLGMARRFKKLRQLREDTISELYVETGENKEAIGSQLDTVMPIILVLFAWTFPILSIAKLFRTEDKECT